MKRLRLPPPGAGHSIGDVNTHLPLLVFTDLDGTLLCHRTYRWDAARPALEALRHIGAGVVLASSKTAAEIISIRQGMGLEAWPAIVENGAGLLPAGCRDLPPGTDYAALRRVLGEVRRGLRCHFRGFGDMDTAEIAAVTGLAPSAAAQAAQRAFSEPGMWSGEAAARAEFIDHLARHGVSAREGGRFLTLSFGVTKADRMAEIIARYRPHKTLALGDAPNDVEMLEAAGHGVIVANPHRDPLPRLDGEAEGHITRTTQAGPRGWNLAVLDQIDRIMLKQGNGHV